MHLKLPPSHYTMTIDDGHLSMTAEAATIFEGLDDPVDVAALRDEAIAWDPVASLERAISILVEADTAQGLCALLDSLAKIKDALRETLEMSTVWDAGIDRPLTDVERVRIENAIPRPTFGIGKPNPNWRETKTRVTP